MDYLCSGLEYGFDTLVSDTNLKTKEYKNLLSARENADIVQERLDSECAKGYAYGPFSEPPFENYRVSPIGIAVGKYSGKKRLIIDLSSPHNSKSHSSINNLIDKDQCTLSYVRIVDAISKICEFGKGTVLCKFDIQDAFKHCPVTKDQWHLFLVRWNRMYYVLTRLAFGCRSSPRIFDNLAQAVCWIASNNYNIHCILHLLDDFLTIDLPSSDGESTFSTMISIFNILKVPLSKNKLEGQCTCLEYLGVILDSDKMQCRLPAVKVERIMNFIKELLSKRSCTKRELLQLLGHMNFASRVILAGRAFVSYLLALASSVSELHYYVHLNSECRQDLHMWMEFLSNWNGVSLFYESDFTSSFDIQLHTDAASTAGFSVVYKTHWISEKWPAEMPSIPDNLASMAFMELYPIVVAAYTFGREWQQKKIMFVCDNQSVNSILRKGRSRCHHIMKLMRTLTWLALTNNFYFSSSYIESKKNVYADLLSRLQVEKFKELRPDADPQPTPSPSPDNLLWNYKVQ